MKMTTLKSVAIAVGLASSAFGQATSPIVGYDTTVIPGSPGGNARVTTVIGPRFVNKTEVSGIATVSGDVVTIAGVSLTAGQFAPIAAGSLSGGSNPELFQYFLETEDGFWAQIASNTADSVTLTAGNGDQITDGETVFVKKHVVVGEYFGNVTPALTGSDAGDATAADQIVIVDQNAGTTAIIFPSTAVGSQFIDDGFNDADNWPIYPDQGVQVSRLSSGNVSLVFAGSLDDNPRQIPVASGVNVRAIALQADATLGELNLFTGDAATGVAPAAFGDTSVADTINLLVGGQTSVFFFSPDDLGSGPGWYDDSFNFVNDTVLPQGAGIVINRTNPTDNSPFTWVSPAPVVTP